MTEPPKIPEQDPAEDEETFIEAFEKAIAKYPGRFVKAKPAGEAIAILGARPTTKSPAKSK
jgi:hypothetical protein